MAIVSCPHCHGDVEVRIQGTAPRRQGNGIVSSDQLKATLRFMRRLGAGRRTSVYLVSLYEELRASDPAAWPSMNSNVLGRALRLNGAEAWRTSDERGWDIPAVPEDQAAAKPTPSTQAREEREFYEAAVIEHASDPGPRGQERSTPARPLFRDLSPLPTEGVPGS